jgi:hypothetical protein
MKLSKVLLAGMLAMALVFGLVLAGCGGNGDPTSPSSNTGDNTGNNGGNNTGEDNTGGNNTGDNTGGDNTGGNDTGGNNTGGNDTGGNNTSGNDTGGGTTVTKPGVPTGVKATALTSTSIQISWDAVSGATSYKIYSPEKAGSDSGFELLDTVTTNSYTDSTVQASQTWYYKVSAVNSLGESAQSGSVFAKTPNPLSKPTNVAASGSQYSNNPNTSRTSIKITWDAVSGAVSYNVYKWETTLGGYWKKVGSATGTEWTHTGLEPDTAEVYRIRAVDSGGTEGADSASVTGYTAE